MSVISNNTLAGSSGQGGAGGYEIERSLRFTSGDSAYLSKNFAGSGTTKLTVSFWLKNGSDSTNNPIAWVLNFGQTSALTGAIQAYVNSTGSFEIFVRASTYGYVITTPKFRDFSAWRHIVFSIDTTQSSAADQIKLWNNGEAVTSFSTQQAVTQNTTLAFGQNTRHTIGAIASSSGSLSYADMMLADFHAIDNQILSASDFGEYDDNNLWQPKKFAGTYGTNGFHLDFSDISSNAALGTDSSGNSNTWTVNNLVAASGIGPGITSTVPQDLTGDWRGIIGIVPTNTSGAVAVFPDGGGTANSKGTFFWSGLTIGDKITWYGTASGSTRNVTGDIDETSVSTPGASLGSFQLTVNAASGSAKIDFNGAANCYGITPGPVSSQYNDALRDTPVNGDSADDTGAGGEITGNYATLNPLAEQASGSITLSNGNLTATVGGTRSSSFGTMALEGKTYWEIVFTGGAYVFGMADASMFNTTANTAPNAFIGASSTSWGIGNDGTVYNNGATQGTETSWTNGDVMGWSYDSSNGAIKIYKNGTLNGSYTASTANTYFPAATLIGSGASVDVNFGQRPFAYTAPSGYKCLNTANLPDPTIADGSTAFEVSTWSGTGSAQSITTNMSPDLVWVKDRGPAPVSGHKLEDIVRGAGKYLSSNTTGAEVSPSNGISSFNANGYTLGTDNAYNGTGHSYVGWAWDGGSSTVTNTDGSISSQVRANPSAGFSITKFTAASSMNWAHGLNAAPDFVLLKGLDSTSSWYTYHSGAPNKLLMLDSASVMNGTYFTVNSSTVSAPSLSPGNTDEQIAYQWTAVEGYSAFGSYTGNGSADGPFVYTGFRPRFVMTKASSASGLWNLHDTERSNSNPTSKLLWADSSSAEVDYAGGEFTIDCLSNGFKLRASTASLNTSGVTYIYAAFAENPFKTSRAR